MSTNPFSTLQPFAGPSRANEHAEEDEDAGAVLDTETGLILPGDVKVAYEVRANTAVVPARTQQDSVQATAAVLGLETQALTYKDFALELIPASGLKNKLVAFINAPHPPADESLVPVDAFLSKSDRTDWDTHCITVKQEWQLFCSKVDHLSGGQIELKHMAAPSGPARSKVAMLWHYPTFTSGNSVFSHVMDPDSPSLWVQKTKMGLDGGVKTLDIYPFRVDYDHGSGPEWEKRFDNWQALRTACLEHAKELVNDDRLLVVVGDEIWQEAKWLVTSRGWALTYIELETDTKMFGRKPRIYLALDAQRKIQQVLIRVWHGQYIYHNKHEQRGAMWDLMWNTACNIAGVEIQNPVLLTWAATHFLRSSSQDPSVASKRPGSHTVFMALRRKQDQEKRLLTVEEVRQYFPNLLRRCPELDEHVQQAADKGHAPLSAIEQHYIQKSVRTRQERKTKREAESPVAAPAPKRVATDAKKIMAAGKSAVARKSDQDRKWEALLSCHQVRQAEANRHDPGKTVEHARALERIDKMKALLDEGESKKFTAELSAWAVFYHPKKYPRGLRYRPDHGTDPYTDVDHPAVVITRQARVRDATERQSLAGPEEE